MLGSCNQDSKSNSLLILLIRINQVKFNFPNSLKWFLMIKAKINKLYNSSNLSLILIEKKINNKFNGLKNPKVNQGLKVKMWSRRLKTKFHFLMISKIFSIIHNLINQPSIKIGISFILRLKIYILHKISKEIQH